MAAVKIYIDKFKKEVIIDDTHFLYVAQLEKNAKKGATKKGEKDDEGGDPLKKEEKDSGGTAPLKKGEE